MKIKVVTVGLPQLPFAKEGIAEYLKRISRFADLELIHVKENKNTDKKIIEAVGNYQCLLLEEKGREYSTQELSEFIQKQKNNSHNIALVIGGPNGHSEVVQALSKQSMSLSKLTFPHDIALMLLLETLYRSFTILAGHPYHRA